MEKEIFVIGYPFYKTPKELGNLVKLLNELDITVHEVVRGHYRNFLDNECIEIYRLICLGNFYNLSEYIDGYYKTVIESKILNPRTMIVKAILLEDV